ncbi:hypothetical protein AGLY_002093 [Aphis glycines]|uniref:Uncharacterized protein n=1 Tax=Aphis glycines TaxID=307491 RepID=A0A6G0U414_APHGL|nr:hypothetical protein AGLY_002093 [Aphis glycines]
MDSYLQKLYVKIPQKSNGNLIDINKNEDKNNFVNEDVSEKLLVTSEVNIDLTKPKFDRQSSEIESLSDSFIWKNDPTIYLKITRYTPEMLSMILKLGPCQPKVKHLPNSQFPKVDNRCCHEAWHFRKLPDGTMMHKDWSTYSPSINRVLCLHCMLFGKKVRKPGYQMAFVNSKNVLCP